METKRMKTSRPTARWISRVAGGAKRNIAVLVVVDALLGISGVFNALTMRELINAAVAGNRSGFFAAAVFYVGLAAFQIAFGAISSYLAESTVCSIENRFKTRLFSTLLSRDYASVTKTHSGEWMNRLSSDAVIVANAMTGILPSLTSMLVSMIGAAAALFWLDRRILFVLIPGGLVMTLLTYTLSGVLKRMHKDVQESGGRLWVFLSERLGSLMIVRTFAQERRTVDKAAQLMEEHKRARMKRSRFSVFCSTGLRAAMNGVYLLAAIYCGYGILAGTMGYGNLMAVVQLVGQVQSPLVNITNILPRYYTMIASAERLMEAEGFEGEDEGKIPEKDVNRFYVECFRGLELQNVAFSYQLTDDSTSAMPVVLSDLNLEIKKGEYVAFTGPSGCGKSTVLKLLMCLYPLSEGERNLQTASGMQPLTSAWRGLFAYVPQGNQLLSGSIRSVITFGDEAQMRQDDELHRALRIACADRFVSELENGLDTLLGERGAGLSEGQMQRIAIARAVFSNHPILLLDEATSSLDEETERRLLHNLRTMTDKTVIIVTHRSAALKICDKQVDFGKGM